MNKKGVTLTEVLFAVGIIAMVIAGVLIIFAQTVEVSRRINYEYAATNLAKARVERARSVISTNGFTALADMIETEKIIDAEGTSDSDGEFKRSTDVLLSYGGNSRLTQIQVDVVYKIGGGWKDSIPVTMVTVFSDIE